MMITTTTKTKTNMKTTTTIINIIRNKKRGITRLEIASSRTSGSTFQSLWTVGECPWRFRTDEGKDGQCHGISRWGPSCRWRRIFCGVRNSIAVHDTSVFLVRKTPLWILLSLDTFTWSKYSSSSSGNFAWARVRIFSYIAASEWMMRLVELLLHGFIQHCCFFSTCIRAKFSCISGCSCCRSFMLTESPRRKRS